jgi:hypothetical protein
VIGVCPAGALAGMPDSGDQHRAGLEPPGLLRRAARGLLRALDGVTGPDEPETRGTLRVVVVAIEARRGDWPRE